MDRLRYVVLFTDDVARMKHFYETFVGLAIHRDSPGWVEFATGGATLALQAVPDASSRGVQLRFATDDIDARARDLAARGARLDPPGVATYPWGRNATLSDPEGNALMLLQAASPEPPGRGFALSAALNCRDLAGATAYYRDVLGFAIPSDSPWWVQLSAGEAGLGLHPRAQRPGVETHHGGAITIGFGIPDLGAWTEEARDRGLEFIAPPADRGYGIFADAVDPDANAISFRDVPEPETLEEQLAEPFEGDATPHQVAMRKPVKKRVTAATRSRPTHKAKPAASRPRTTKASARVASPRGTGPAGARQQPKRKHDSKRARAKPAIGRLRKAERRTLERKKVAVATTGKTRPVKRAASRTARAKTPRRAATRARR